MTSRTCSSRGSTKPSLAMPPCSPTSRTAFAPSPPTMAPGAAGAATRAIRAIPATPRSTICRAAIRPSPTSQRLLTAPRRRALPSELAFRLAAQTSARQPVGQFAQGRRASLGPSSTRTAILVGTFYVEVPEGSGRDPLRRSPTGADDGRAGRAATTRPRNCARSQASTPRPGMLLLWESWLRHEVLPGPAKAERLSISFNFA